MSAPCMKKKIAERPPLTEDELRAEYDFSQAVRGKYYHPLQEGYTIKVHNADGTTEVQQVTFEQGIIRLDPDIQAYFPDSQSVNRILRSLVTMMRQLYPQTLSDKKKSKQHIHA